MRASDERERVARKKTMAPVAQEKGGAAGGNPNNAFLYSMSRVLRMRRGNEVSNEMVVVVTEEVVVPMMEVKHHGRGRVVVCQ